MTANCYCEVPLFFKRSLEKDIGSSVSNTLLPGTEMLSQFHFREA